MSCALFSVHGLVQYKGPVQVARRSDMDMNGHINNVTYLALALETVPIDIYLNYILIQVRRKCTGYTIIAYEYEQQIAGLKFQP